MKKVLIPRCPYAGGIGQQCLESHPQPLSQERVASAGRLTILPPVGMAKSSGMIDFYISTSIESTRQTQQFNQKYGLSIKKGVYNPTLGQYW